MEAYHPRKVKLSRSSLLFLPTKKKTSATMPRTAAAAAAAPKARTKRAGAAKVSARAKRAAVAKKAKTAAKVRGVVKKKTARVQRRHVASPAAAPAARATAKAQALRQALAATQPAAAATVPAKSAAVPRLAAPLVVDGVTGNTLRQRQWSRRRGLEKRVEDLYAATGCSALLITLSPGGQQRSGRIHLVGTGVLELTDSTLISSVLPQLMTGTAATGTDVLTSLRKVTISKFMTALVKHEDRAATD